MPPVKKKTTTSKKTTLQKKKQGNNIFALDIGTRTVIGIVGYEKDGVFNVLDYVSIPHTSRSMNDGQIEDIDAVAKVVGEVKSTLEKRLNMKLNHASIAAAGRALKTSHVTITVDVPSDTVISEELKKSYELEAVLKAQSEIDKTMSADDILSFYCVGHTVMSYALDGYPIQSIIGHKAHRLDIEIIAAFLPSVVVESLYNVIEKNNLSVASLTLEPIAAMNVIIPPEIRLINIALVDIGAGTSDIAISKDGKIVAYAMATTAGDEITEEIIKHYLVDFDTAERIKLSYAQDNITYTDILGMSNTIDKNEFQEVIIPAVEALAETISQNILSANGASPSAVFLVGGGSQIPMLSELISKKLNISPQRVAVGSSNFLKKLIKCDEELNNPEYVTPLGIAVTATIQKDYEFSTITVNDKKFRVLDTKNLTVLDVLMLAGYKTRQIIARTGRNLAFTYNTQKVIINAKPSLPCKLLQNDAPTTIDSKITQGDKITFIPAQNGVSAKCKLVDYAGIPVIKNIEFDNNKYICGNIVKVNGAECDADYEIQSGDIITSCQIDTLDDLAQNLEINESEYIFYLGEVMINADYILKDGDKITTQKIKSDKNVYIEEVLEDPTIENNILENTSDDTIEDKKVLSQEITITLNNRPLTLPIKEDNTPYEFFELFTYVNLENKPGKPLPRILLNGKDAQYIDIIKNGDIIEIIDK